MPSRVAGYEVGTSSLKRRPVSRSSERVSSWPAASTLAVSAAGPNASFTGLRSDPSGAGVGCTIEQADASIARAATSIVRI